MGEGEGGFAEGGRRKKSGGKIDTVGRGVKFPEGEIREKEAISGKERAFLMLYGRYSSLPFLVITLR